MDCEKYRNRKSKGATYLIHKRIKTDEVIVGSKRGLATNGARECFKTKKIFTKINGKRKNKQRGKRD